MAVTERAKAGQFINEVEVAKRLGLSCSTLRAWRFRGVGPVYHKFGKSVRYHVDDVAAYVAENREDDARQSA